MSEQTKVMSERHPYSGLTDDECKELEAAGWRETGLESLPPPWASPDGDLDNPRFALARVRAAKEGGR